MRPAQPGLGKSDETIAWLSACGSVGHNGLPYSRPISWGRSSCEALSLDGQAGKHPSSDVAHFGSTPPKVDLEQVLAARLKCDLDSTLTPPPVAVVEVCEPLRCSTEIGEQSAQGIRALDA